MAVLTRDTQSLESIDWNKTVKRRVRERSACTVKLSQWVCRLLQSIYRSLLAAHCLFSQGKIFRRTPLTHCTSKILYLCTQSATGKIQQVNLLWPPIYFYCNFSFYFLRHGSNLVMTIPAMSTQALRLKDSVFLVKQCVTQKICVHSVEKIRFIQFWQILLEAVETKHG